MVWQGENTDVCLMSGGTNAVMITNNVVFNCLVTAEFARFLYCDAQNIPTVSLKPWKQAPVSSWSRGDSKQVLDFLLRFDILNPVCSPRPVEEPCSSASPFSYLLLLGNTVGHCSGLAPSCWWVLFSPPPGLFILCSHWHGHLNPTWRHYLVFLGSILSSNLTVISNSTDTFSNA